MLAKIKIKKKENNKKIKMKRVNENVLMVCKAVGLGSPIVFCCETRAEDGNQKNKIK